MTTEQAAELILLLRNISGELTALSLWACLIALCVAFRRLR